MMVAQVVQQQILAPKVKSVLQYFFTKTLFLLESKFVVLDLSNYIPKGSSKSEGHRKGSTLPSCV